MAVGLQSVQVHRLYELSRKCLLKARIHSLDSPTLGLQTMNSYKIFVGESLKFTNSSLFMPQSFTKTNSISRRKVKSRIPAPCGIHTKCVFHYSNSDFIASGDCTRSLVFPNQEISCMFVGSTEVPIIPPDGDTPGSPIEFPPFSSPSELPDRSFPEVPTIPSQPEIPLPEVPHGPSVPIPNVPPITPPGTPPPTPMPEVPPNAPPGSPPLTPPPQTPPITPDFPTPPPSEPPGPEVNPQKVPPSGFFEV